MVSSVPQGIVVLMDRNYGVLRNQVIVEGTFGYPSWQNKLHMSGSVAHLYDFRSECRHNGTDSLYQLLVSTSTSGAKESGGRKRSGTSIAVYCVPPVVAVVVAACVVIIILGVKGRLRCLRKEVVCND